MARPTMRFVPIKSRERQAALSMRRARNLLVKQRTQSVNMMRGLLAAFGINIPDGLERALTMARQTLEGNAPGVLAAAVKIIFALSQQALDTHAHIRGIDRALALLPRSGDTTRRLATIPGIGPIGATAPAASVTDPGQFRSGRQFAAWLGLAPLQNSSGGKGRLGRISKMGDEHLRRLLVIGAAALVRYAKSKPGTAHLHRVSLLARKPVRAATVAMAHNMARIAWAIMTRGEIYRPDHVPALSA